MPEPTQPRPVMIAARWIAGLSVIGQGWIPLALEFGWIDWTASQISQVSVFIGVLTGAIAYIMGLNAESKVTPTESPRDDELVPLVPVASDGAQD